MKMFYARIAFLAVLSPIILEGCSSLATTSETIRGPSRGNQQKVGMFATDSTARVIIVNANNGKFCAEPPPETQLTESVTMRFLASAEKIDDANAKVELFKAYSQAVQQLYKRSHSNAMFRDASYYLCQAYLNGALTDQNLTQTVLAAAKILTKGLSKGDQEKAETKIREFLELVPKSNTGAAEGPPPGPKLPKNDAGEKSVEQGEKQGAGPALGGSAGANGANVASAGSGVQVSVNPQAKSYDSAYLDAQILLAEIAFVSLGDEFKPFYGAELAEQRGRAAALNEGIGKVNDGLTQMKGTLDAVDSVTKATATGVGEANKKLDKIAEGKKNEVADPAPVESPNPAPNPAPKTGEQPAK